MTKDAIKMFRDGDFSPDSIKDLHISFETMLTQVPIVIKNSHLINALLLDMQEKLPLSSGGAQYLDLGTATTLETQIRSMMDSVDELNQESIKFKAPEPGAEAVPGEDRICAEEAAGDPGQDGQGRGAAA